MELMPERSQGQGEESKWISVKERLPEIETEYLVWSKMWDRKIGFFYQGKFRPIHDNYPVEYWQPLPVAPEPEKGVKP